MGLCCYSSSVSLIKDMHTRVRRTCLKEMMKIRRSSLYLRCNNLPYFLLVNDPSMRRVHTTSRAIEALINLFFLANLQSAHTTL